MAWWNPLSWFKRKKPKDYIKEDKALKGELFGIKKVGEYLLAAERCTERSPFRIIPEQKSFFFANLEKAREEMLNIEATKDKRERFFRRILTDTEEFVPQKEKMVRENIWEIGWSFYEIKRSPWFKERIRTLKSISRDPAALEERGFGKLFLILLGEISQLSRKLLIFFEVTERQLNEVIETHQIIRAPSLAGELARKTGKITLRSSTLRLSQERAKKWRASKNKSNK